MKNVLTAFALSVLCTTYTYAALPAIPPTEKLNDPTTLKNTDPNEPKTTNPQLKEITYSSDNLPDKDKIAELSKMFNIPIRIEDIANDPELLHTALKALETYLPYKLPEINGYIAFHPEKPGSTDNLGGGGEIDVSVPRTTESYSKSLQQGLPKYINGDNPVDTTIANIIHEEGHTLQTLNGFPNDTIEKNIRVSQYCDSEEWSNEATPEFSALAHLYPEVMEYYAQTNPNAKTAYDAYKNYYASRNLPLPTQSLGTSNYAQTLRKNGTVKTWIGKK